MSPRNQPATAARPDLGRGSRAPHHRAGGRDRPRLRRRRADPVHRRAQGIGVLHGRPAEAGQDAAPDRLLPDLELRRRHHRRRDPHPQGRRHLGARPRRAADRGHRRHRLHAADHHGPARVPRRPQRQAVHDARQGRRPARSRSRSTTPASRSTTSSSSATASIWTITSATCPTSGSTRETWSENPPHRRRPGRHRPLLAGRRGRRLALHLRPGRPRPGHRRAGRGRLRGPGAPGPRQPRRPSSRPPAAASPMSSRPPSTSPTWPTSRPSTSSTARRWATTGRRARRCRWPALPKGALVEIDLVARIP